MVLRGSIVIYSHALKLSLPTRSLLFKQGQLQTWASSVVAMAQYSLLARGNTEVPLCQTMGMEMCRRLQIQPPEDGGKAPRRLQAGCKKKPSTSYSNLLPGCSPLFLQTPRCSALSFPSPLSHMHFGLAYSN